MSVNYYRIYDSSNIETNFSKLQSFCSKTLSNQELNTIIFELQACKDKLNDEFVEKNEAVFKIFLDKVNSLTPSSDINQSLIKLLSTINFRNFKTSSLFDQYDSNKPSEEIENSTNSSAKADKYTGMFLDIGDLKKGDSSTTSDKRPASNYDDRSTVSEDLTAYVHYNNLTSNFNNFLQIQDSFLSDVSPTTEMNPEENFRDAFVLNHQYKFTSPLLIQSNPEHTKFDSSNYVYFTNMPFVYPLVKTEDNFTKKRGKVTKQKEGSGNSSDSDSEIINDDISLNNLVLKQLTNEILIRNSVNLNNNQSYHNFIKKFLLRSLDNSRFNPEVQILRYYQKSPEQTNKTVLDIREVEQARDYLEDFFASDIYNDPSFEENFKNKRITKGSRKVSSSSSIMINSDFMNFKRSEIDNQLKKAVESTIFCNGFLKFPSYSQKTQFLLSPGKIFGVHLFGKRIEFFDADFCNMLKMTLKNHISSKNDSLRVSKIKGLEPFKSEMEGISSLVELLNLLNIELKSGNYHGDLLEKPQYIDSNLNFSDLKEGDTIMIRMNSFMNALEASEILNSAAYLQKSAIVNMVKPEISYYNEHFISGMDLVLQNTVKNFNSLLACRSNYES
eukprot:CAMPEP_0170528256 /NCGR_PEP_ID=MMETSP0209-20121228/13758_1 /TAXON_ID=665100 ORGANISM="Litonotus pictus, Strain P1" /NCGR_SAMPLE_ID=MMETSP0209 /ASSEMBLY_ACC=CAM_ASM_000301 /LENGTH=613 /DNA_ID=CAMNT_0010819353 /DNA_START=384 /DNA_END=2225 /DNA_ORIENTATION=+